MTTLEHPTSAIVSQMTSETFAALVEGRPVIVRTARHPVSYLVLAGDRVTGKSLSFLITHTDGFVSAAVDGGILDRLQLPPMVHTSEATDGADYTVSVDAAEGITTGISALDRAHTIRLIANPGTGPQDFVRPGHVLPVRSADGWGSVFHDAAVQLMRGAGVAPVAAMAPLIDDQGDIVVGTALRQFADEHGIPLFDVPDDEDVERPAEPRPPTVEIDGRTYRLYHYRVGEDLEVLRVAMTRYPSGDAPSSSAQVSTPEDSARSR
jgi:3,4-dihydroxy 2-butanone 4-phosphate synthase/GTP cyclohydrolase II